MVTAYDGAMRELMGLMTVWERRRSQAQRDRIRVLVAQIELQIAPTIARCSFAALFLLSARRASSMSRAGNARSFFHPVF